jgi:TPR repeat protein
MKCIIGAAALCVVSPALAQYSPPPQTSVAGTGKTFCSQYEQALAIANRAAGQPYHRPPAGCFAVAPEVTITILQSYPKLSYGGAIWQVQLGRTTGFLAFSLAPSVPPVAAAVKTPAKVASSQPTLSETRIQATKPSDGTFATASLPPVASPRMKSGEPASPAEEVQSPKPQPQTIKKEEPVILIGNEKSVQINRFDGPNQALNHDSAANGAPTTDCDTYATLETRIGSTPSNVPFERINPALAIPACEDAVRRFPNERRLIFQLGRAYSKNNDIESALVQFQKAASLGYAPAQTNLGYMYREGSGVVKDASRALDWFTRAAGQDYMPAQNALGYAYDHGDGVRTDHAQAAAWYQRAAEQGDAQSQAVLGNLYATGDGVTKDAGQAVAWYRRAAAQGHPMAQSLLANMYLSGEGAAKDEAQAVAWFRKAADQGLPAAQYSLGFLYQHGRGVTINRQLASDWFRKAAAQGYRPAQTALAEFQMQPSGIDAPPVPPENTVTAAPESRGCYSAL